MAEANKRKVKICEDELRQKWKDQQRAAGGSPKTTSCEKKQKSLSKHREKIHSQTDRPLSREETKSTGGGRQTPIKDFPAVIK